MSGTRRFIKKLNRFVWISFVLGLIVVALLFFLISKTKMPDTYELENPSYEYASIIYSHDLRELGRYFKYNREAIGFETLNPNIVNALIATEDERYFKHNGIDLRSTARAVLYLGKKGGASTISQQLAKLFFTDRSSNFIKRVWQKLKEWVIAIEFERRYTKEEIIAMYLNKFDFIYNSYGVQAAASTYFGKDQANLSVAESALLVGMLKNPWAYNPKNFPANALNRRNVVLGQMVRNGYLGSEEFNRIKDEEIDMSKFNRSVHYKGPAPYFRATLTSHLKELLSQDKFLKPDGSKYNIYEDGLQIYTTIDLDMQRHAESAMTRHMSELQNRYFKRWDGQDPWTYEADDRQKKIRNRSLERQITQSDRFQNIKNRALQEITKNILTDFPDARLWDADIDRMLKAQKDKKYLSKLYAEDFISKEQKNRYEKIMASTHWKELEQSWYDLRKKAEVVFSKPVKMKIFDHEKGEKIVTMSPLDSVRYHRMHMQLGSVAMDPNTGYVKTWVGGIGNKYFQYDHVQSDRQVGSTFKPFVYATAISQQAMSPCQRVKDIQYTIPAKDPNFGLMETWAPENADGTFTGIEMTLKEALRKSRNSISLWLMKELGSTEVVRSLASDMGIKKSKVPNAPSICLGAADLNVMEMTAAYCSFANNGIYRKPIFITKIVDKNGRVVFNAVPEQRRVMQEEYNHVMVEMLKYATHTHNWRLESEFGGKTGTTNDYVDGWFMGISPELVVGTWVGGEDPWIRFKTLQDGQGGVMARPFYFDFMKRLEADPKIQIDVKKTFSRPAGDLIETDCSKYETKAKFQKVVPVDSLAKQRDDEFEEEGN